MKKKKMAMDMPQYKRKSTARFSLEDNGKLPKLVMGGIVSVTIKGKVKSFNTSEYDRSFEVEIQEMDTDSGMAGDMKQIKKKRTALDMDEED